jgi:type I restriction enzyme, S subunit
VRWYANGCHLHTATLGHVLKTKSLSTVRAGDITYNKMWTSKGAFGVVQPEQDGFVATSEYPLFIPRDSALSPAFLGYVFRQAQFWAAARALCKGTTQRARLNPDDFLRLEIDLPFLPEQERIVAMLRAVDGAIQANEEVIVRTRDVKRALAHELLTHGLPGRHTRFKDSPLGRIPAKWEVKSLEELLLRIDSGMSPKCEDRSAEPSEWGVLKVSAVTGDVFLPHENKVLGLATGSSEHLEVKMGDILLARGNGSAALVAKPVYVMNTQPKLILSDLIYRLVPDPKTLHGRFLCHALIIPAVRRQIEVRLRGTSGIHKISKSSLVEVRIPVPSIDEQSSLGSLIGALEEYLSRAQETVLELAKVQSMIADALFAGYQLIS